LPRPARRRCLSFATGKGTPISLLLALPAFRDRQGYFIFRMEIQIDGILSYAESAPVRFLEAATVQDFRGQRLFASSVHSRALLIWTVVIVAFCLLFHLGNHTLPSRIAAVILR
jgi:hypothetical protein